MCGCVRNNSETHETVLLDCTTSRFSVLSHTYYLETEIRWLLSGWFNILLVTYFLILNLLHCVDESWWNIPFKDTWHGDGVADGVVAMSVQLWLRAIALWRHAVTIRIVASHNAWMGYEYSLWNMNRPRAIHKHNPQILGTICACVINALSSWALLVELLPCECHRTPQMISEHWFW